MNDTIQHALDHDSVIDITTTGRKSGQPRRIEIWHRQVNGRTYITGTPGPRAWYANMLADPHMIFHLKQSTTTDLPAIARPITDPAERQEILTAPNMSWYHQNSESVDEFIENAPLVEVMFKEESS